MQASNAGLLPRQFIRTSEGHSKTKLTKSDHRFVLYGLPNWGVNRVILLARKRATGNAE